METEKTEAREYTVIIYLTEKSMDIVSLYSESNEVGSCVDKIESFIKKCLLQSEYSGCSFML